MRPHSHTVGETKRRKFPPSRNDGGRRGEAVATDPPFLRRDLPSYQKNRDGNNADNMISQWNVAGFPHGSELLPDFFLESNEPRITALTRPGYIDEMLAPDPPGIRIQRYDSIRQDNSFRDTVGNEEHSFAARVPNTKKLVLHL